MCMCWGWWCYSALCLSWICTVMIRVWLRFVWMRSRMFTRRICANWLRPCSLLSLISDLDLRTFSPPFLTCLKSQQLKWSHYSHLRLMHKINPIPFASSTSTLKGKILTFFKPSTYDSMISAQITIITPIINITMPQKSREALQNWLSPWLRRPHNIPKPVLCVWMIQWKSRLKKAEGFISLRKLKIGLLLKITRCILKGRIYALNLDIWLRKSITSTLKDIELTHSEIIPIHESVINAIIRILLQKAKLSGKSALPHLSRNFINKISLNP